MFSELCCNPVGAFWLCLTTYVIFMVAGPKKGYNSRESLHRFMSGFKTRSSQTCQIRETDGISIGWGVHFPSGFVKVSSGRTPSFYIPGSDNWHVGNQLCAPKKELFSRCTVSWGSGWIHREGGKGGGGGLMYTACSINWILLLVAIGMRRLLSLNPSSSGAILKMWWWILTVYKYQFFK